MTNINKFFYRHMDKIIIIILLLNPFFDILTSLSINVLKLNFTIGMIYKIIVLCIFIYYYFFVIEKYNKKTSNIFLLCIFIYVLSNLVYHFLVNNSFIGDFIFSIKCFYFPILLILLWNICWYQEINIDDKYIFYMVCIYAFTIFIAYITNSSFNSYDVSKIGIVGWFNSANEVGNIISICIPFSISYVFKEKKIINYLLSLLIVFSIIVMGTKTPIISLIICIIFFFFKMIFNFIIHKRYKTLILVCLVVFLLLELMIMFLPMIPCYKNLIIHLEYLNIHSFNDFLDIKIFDHFFLGSRLMFLKNTSIIWLDSGILYYLLGIGIDINCKLIEMDIFDIFFRFGIIGLMVYVVPIIYLFKNSLNKDNNYLITIILIILISLTVGHVLIKPSVSMIVSIILIKYLKGNGCCEKI